MSLSGFWFVSVFAVVSWIPLEHLAVTSSECASDKGFFFNYYYVTKGSWCVKAWCIPLCLVLASLHKLRGELSSLLALLCLVGQLSPKTKQQQRRWVKLVPSLRPFHSHSRQPHVAHTPGTCSNHPWRAIYIDLLQQGYFITHSTTKYIPKFEIFPSLGPMEFLLKIGIDRLVGD